MDSEVFLDAAIPTNYVGGTIFWLYIVAAFVLLAIILQTIQDLIKEAGLDKTTDKTREQSRNVKIFSILAAVSFITSSLQMLRFLILSFTTWKRAQINPLSASLVTDIWNWSMESTLFLDFARAIVEDDARFFWVCLGLMITFYCCAAMAQEGIKRDMPRLWAFCGLAQILPIGVTMCLFCLATQYRAVRYPHIGAACWSLARPWSFHSGSTVAVVVFTALLFMARLSRERMWILTILVAARMILFTIFGALEPRKVEGSVRPSNFPVFFVLAVALVNGYSALKQTGSALALLGVVWDHPAVAALGIDAFFGAAAMILLPLLNISAATRSGKMAKNAQNDE